MPNFSIRQETFQGGVAMLSVQGFLDANTFEQFEEAIASVYTSGRYKVIVNLDGVSYISSAGAGVFIWARSEAQANGGDLVLLAPQDSVMEVLKLLGLDKLFMITSERGAAFSAL